jgi:hypothetical protein
MTAATLVHPGAQCATPRWVPPWLWGSLLPPGAVMKHDETVHGTMDKPEI